MIDWVQHNEIILGWLVLISVLTFILSLIIVPFVLVWLPADYFSEKKQSRQSMSAGHPLLQIPFLVLKNIVGAILLVAGVIMLVIPGQGILTIVVALILLDFPGKYQLERWLVERKYVLSAVNWIRIKAGKQELIIDRDYKREG